jgi:hypothetical protein
LTIALTFHASQLLPMRLVHYAAPHR